LTANNAEILAIGDELCYGRVYDKNSFWLANQVTHLGVLVKRITCVRDDIDEICSVLKEMLDRNPNFIFITGGLGPTEDDKTIEALSKLTRRPIIVDKNILKIMSERRKLSSAQLLPHHYKMSSTLAGAKCLPNPIGWASLITLKIKNTTIFTLPGPPKEAQSCFKAYLVNEIQNATHYTSFAKRVTVTIRSESEVSPLVNKIMQTFPFVYLKPLVSEATSNVGLPVEILVFGNDEKVCMRRYRQVIEMFCELIKKRGKNLKEEI
jgi:molybdenum cofactor synthesis domain-containing protein